MSSNAASDHIRLYAIVGWCFLFYATSAESTKPTFPLFAFGLVADTHYDTFPAGEQAPWEPKPNWFRGQIHRTTTTTKRRYDIARDKMAEAVAVMNTYVDDQQNSKCSLMKKGDADQSASSQESPALQSASAFCVPLAFTVNMGDLVNNDLMWNLRPILDEFNKVKSPKFSLLGNHDLRAHNDRFGKNNFTQHRWMKTKVGIVEQWYYAFSYPPFHFIFLDTQLHDEVKSPQRKMQLEFLDNQLKLAQEKNYAAIIFAHIAIGLETNAFGPIIKKYADTVVAMFHGHEHKGGYVQQMGIHSVILHGQIETLTNAFAIAEVYSDRIELTGFGRVPTRVMDFYSVELIEKLRRYQGPSHHDLSSVENQHAPDVLKLWPSDEILQQHPPLNLNLPNYKKPLIPYAEPNTGNTRFVREVYKKWSRRVHTRAPEKPVQLASGNKPVWLVDNLPVEAPPNTVGGAASSIGSSGIETTIPMTESPSKPRRYSKVPAVTNSRQLTSQKPLETVIVVVPAWMLLSSLSVLSLIVLLVARRKRGVTALCRRAITGHVL